MSLSKTTLFSINIFYLVNFLLLCTSNKLISWFKTTNDMEQEFFFFFSYTVFGKIIVNRIGLEWPEIFKGFYGPIKF